MDLHNNKLPVDQMTTRRLLGWASYFLAGLIIWQKQDVGFFWDTIQLGAKHGFWYYDHQFQHLILPTELDSGHPPFFGMYLALGWRLLGQSLVVSHWLLFPFVCLSIHYLIRIGERLVPSISGLWLVLLVYSDPVILTQSLLISPDAVLFSFLVMSIYGILTRKNFLIGLGIIGLGLISMRGMMTGVALFLCQLFWLEKKNLRNFLKILSPYLPGGFIGLAFLLYHYLAVGWIGYHSESPWALSFQKVDFQGAVKNMAIIIWRLLDFGRIILFPFLGWLIFRFIRDKNRPGQLWVLLLSLAACLLPSMILHQYLSAHRYLIPVILSLHLIVFEALFLENRIGVRLKRLIFGSWIVFLISGNFWVYPAAIAQGWDSSLAHWPYYQLRREINTFLSERDIPFEAVGTVFPEIGPHKHRYLNQVAEGFVRLDFENNKYVLYSNVMNDFTNQQLEKLQGDCWEIIYELEQWPITMLLYQRTEKCAN